MIKTTEGQIASDFFNKVHPVLENLYERWYYEKEYEDIKDYQKPLEPIARSRGIRIIKMTKRPFGFVFQINHRNFQAFVSMTKSGWKSTK